MNVKVSELPYYVMFRFVIDDGNVVTTTRVEDILVTQKENGETLSSLEIGEVIILGDEFRYEVTNIRWENLFETVNSIKYGLADWNEEQVNKDYLFMLIVNLRKLED